LLILLAASSNPVVSDLPCSSGGKIITHGARYHVSECYYCECDNSTLSCQNETWHILVSWFPGNINFKMQSETNMIKYFKYCETCSYIHM
jgi:hypothetical protein